MNGVNLRILELLEFAPAWSLQNASMRDGRIHKSIGRKRVENTRPSQREHVAMMRHDEFRLNASVGRLSPRA